LGFGVGEVKRFETDGKGGKAEVNRRKKQLTVDSSELNANGKNAAEKQSSQRKPEERFFARVRGLRMTAQTQK